MSDVHLNSTKVEPYLIYMYYKYHGLNDLLYINELTIYYID